MKIKDLTIGDNIDDSGDVILEIEYGRALAYEYFNKDEAKEIIEHLRKVFEL